MDYISNIKSLLLIKNITCKKIELDNSNDLIEGNICSIYYYKATLKDKKNLYLALKISNFENELSSTAKELNLYNNEVNFYELVTPKINIPNYYGYFNANNNICLLFDNIRYNYKGQFNMKLNENEEVLFKTIDNVFNFHSEFYFKDNIPNKFNNIKKTNEIKYFKRLVEDRFEIFITKRKKYLNPKLLKIITDIKNNYENILDQLSEYPVSLCHGDFKSPNMFYSENKDIILFDWQYLQISKGVSDIVFLMVECMPFDKNLFNKIKEYYFKLLNDKYGTSRETYENDFKNSLSAFPFFVMLWFNCEDEETLEGCNYKDSPLFFMDNYLKCLNEWL